ncbi:hypothetical protein FB45DRAFT_1117142 [Roridomyces roridus]|uniref:Stalled ribosome sensor GCN1-like HEAT repeats region domain-containing protein n=1 Tax=Roridomyces roridus TaxID=1738132 RepID=A0AAD7FAQ5_9AGAR|nr:hypothetical protein FB45DRAFT_1117142 [Roridomyces roridus]
MPPLKRQDTTHSSVFSWWSDSNPLLHTGPTINLHAAAKPLMKWMHHQQALGIIDKHNGVPLTAELLVIYASYLSYKYISLATQRAVLKHLTDRAFRESWSRTKDSSLVGKLLAHQYGIAGQLTFSVGDEDVLLQMTSTLAAVLGQPESALGEALQTLLESETEAMRRWSCILVGNLARQKAAQSVLASSDVIKKLVALLRDSDDDVVLTAMSALAEISQMPGGLTILVATNALDGVGLTLDSTNTTRRLSVCTFVTTLAKSESSVLAILDAIPIQRWSKLLRQVSLIFPRASNRGTCVGVNGCTKLVLDAGIRAGWAQDGVDILILGVVIAVGLRAGLMVLMRDGYIRSSRLGATDSPATPIGCDFSTGDSLLQVGDSLLELSVVV